MTDETNADPAAPPQGDTTSTPVEKREVPDAEKAFVKQWCSRITAAKKHHDKSFKRMDYCAKIAKNGADDDWLKKDDRYVVPVINRHINQSTAQLYAKNPKALAKRAKRRMNTVWDGNLASLKEATDSIKAATQSMMPPPPPMPGAPPMP